MPPLLEHPVEHLLARLEETESRWIIGMAGLPGSGKSTLAAQLTEEVNRRTEPDAMRALGMDGFHLSKLQLSALPNPAEAFARRGAPWTFDTGAFLQRLQLLRESAGRVPVFWPDFQHEVGDPVEDAFFITPTTRLILVEGLYLLHDGDGWDAIRQFFDERWFLDTPLDVALERLTLRHMNAWKWTRAQAQERIAANDRLNAEVVLPSREFAQWRLAG